MRQNLFVFFGVIFFASILPILGNINIIPDIIFGFNLTGWSWLSCLIISIYIIIDSKVVNFPIIIWMPWILYLIVYLSLDFSFLGLQLTLQYLVPILVGIAASTFIFTKKHLHEIFKWISYYTIFLLISLIIRYLLGEREFAAAGVMYITLYTTLILSIFYLKRRSKFLIYYVILFLFPLFFLTRMAIALMLLIVPLHFANKSLVAKILFSIIILFASVLIFNSAAFQNKMFLGNETVNLDLNSFKNEDLFDLEKINTNGRKNLSLIMEEGLKKSPILGNGPRSDLAVFEYEGLWIKEAHNDYLSIRYNYGWLGLGILISCFLFQFIYILNKNNSKDLYIKVLTTSSLTLFIVLFGFMYSDNILKYSINFGNFQFIMIGILSSIYKNNPRLFLKSK